MNDYDDGDDGEDHLELVRQAWRADPATFCASFEIANKDTQIIDVELSPPQLQALNLLQTVNKGVILKGRQMWITTLMLFWQLRLCWMQPGSRCAVVMQTDVNAVLMSAVCLKLYRGNEFLTEEMPLDGPGAGHRLGFQNGSEILFVSGNSPTLRSLNFNFAHFTEVKDYDDLGGAIASMKLAPTGQTFIESTAGGEDDYHAIWQDADPRNEHRSAYIRLFLCWRDHPEYRSDKPLPKLTEFERSYIVKHGLKMQEASWWVHERRALPPAKRANFISEHPSSADEAFKLAGDRYLKRQVPIPSAEAPDPDEFGITRIATLDVTTGIRAHYHPTHQYVAGIDPAPGSKEGDPTAIVILDVTARAVCLTQQLHEATREHEPYTRKLLALYGDPVTNIETAGAGEGPGLIHYLRTEGVPMYMMLAYGGLNPEMLPRHGFRTDPQSRPFLLGEVHEAAIGESPWEMGDRRLVKELNALCHDKRGKVAAPKNGRDDLALALGLALLAVPQALPPAKARVVAEPRRSLLEQWEASLAAAIDGRSEKGDSFSDVPLDRKDFF